MNWLDTVHKSGSPVCASLDVAQTLAGMKEIKSRPNLRIEKWKYPV
jgi:hypothetical protein